MILHEKGLCRLLKQEHKKNGYVIVQEGSLTVIGVARMAVVMQSSEVPRQLLGLLVEHSGEVPKDCAIRVMDGVDNQTMLRDAGLGARTSVEDAFPAEHTAIIWDGCARVYQCQDGRVFAIEEKYLETVSGAAGDPVVDLEHEVAAWYGTDEEIYVPIVTKKENAHLAALESHRWTL